MQVLQGFVQQAKRARGILLKRARFWGRRLAPGAL